jgi:hypothetical protein
LRNANTEPLSSFGLPTPHHKRKITVEPDGEEANQQNKVKKSAKMKEKNSKNMSINKLAQEVLAQNCGIIREDEDLDDMTLQQYIDMYEHPLIPASNIEAHRSSYREKEEEREEYC